MRILPDKGSWALPQRLAHSWNCAPALINGWKKRSCSWSPGWEGRQRGRTRCWAGLWVWPSLLLVFHPTPRINARPRVRAAGNCCCFVICVFYEACSDGAGWNPHGWWESLKRCPWIWCCALMCFGSALPKLPSCCFSPNIEKPVMSPAWWAIQVGSFFFFFPRWDFIDYPGKTQLEPWIIIILLAAVAYHWPGPCRVWQSMLGRRGGGGQTLKQAHWPVLFCQFPGFSVHLFVLFLLDI